MSPVSQSANGAVVTCKIVPSASKSEIAEMGEGGLRVRIAAPPVDGKANKELTRFFSKLFGVSKSAVQIIKGESNKNKTVLIAGLGADEATRILKSGAK
ncbi:MAG: YggU family protein [Nitrospinae bacterium]|nr:YggU family protein [Nitrospinota bacterium]